MLVGVTPSARATQRVCTRRCEGLSQGKGTRGPRRRPCSSSWTNPGFSQLAPIRRWVVPTRTQRRTGGWIASSMDPADRNIARQPIYQGGSMNAHQENGGGAPVTARWSAPYAPADRRRSTSSSAASRASSCTALTGSAFRLTITGAGQRTCSTRSRWRSAGDTARHPITSPGTSLRPACSTGDRRG